MYTYAMTWPFRALVLSILLIWGLAPQIACFMPDHALTQAEMDCCKEMMGECNMPNMSDACCKTAVRTDIAIAAKVLRHDGPQLDIAHIPAGITVEFSSSFDRRLSKQTDHAPPDKPGGSTLVLRI